MNKHIASRKLYRRTGTEGPAHDPYSFTEMTVKERFVDGSKLDVTLHLGLALWVSINGRKTASYDHNAVAKFYDLTGLGIDEFERAYDRVHPYFDDPMGSPGDYI